MRRNVQNIDYVFVEEFDIDDEPEEIEIHQMFQRELLYPLQTLVVANTHGMQPNVEDNLQ